MWVLLNVENNNYQHERVIMKLTSQVEILKLKSTNSEPKQTL